MLSIGEGAKESYSQIPRFRSEQIIIREKSLSDNELEGVRAKFSQAFHYRMQMLLGNSSRSGDIASQAELNSEIKYSDKVCKIYRYRDYA